MNEESKDLEAPLAGLLHKEFKDMTQAEKRQQVAYLQNLRSSSQALSAEFRKGMKEKKTSEFDDFV